MLGVVFLRKTFLFEDLIFAAVHLFWDVPGHHNSGG